MFRRSKTERVTTRLNDGEVAGSPTIPVWLQPYG